jgi:hypothetical protein
MRFVYADPPYLGCGASHYGEHHADAADFDRLETHAALVGRLNAEFDAWALSLHTPSLGRILSVCPADVRVGAWVKPFASFKPGVNPAYAWEPVIFRGGRKLGREVRTVRDWVSVEITLRRGLTGAKPAAFCWWVFDFLGMEPEDEFTDLFPGSGAVGRAYELWKVAKAGFPLLAAGKP